MPKKVTETPAVDTFSAIRVGEKYYRYLPPSSWRPDEDRWTTDLNEAKLFHDPRQAIAFVNSSDDLTRDNIVTVEVTRKVI